MSRTISGKGKLIKTILLYQGVCSETDGALIATLQTVEGDARPRADLALLCSESLASTSTSKEALIAWI